MSHEINVVASTQEIHVDPASHSVSIVNAGPIGPGGPPGATVPDTGDLNKDAWVASGSGAIIRARRYGKIVHIDFHHSGGWPGTWGAGLRTIMTIPVGWRTPNIYRRVGYHVLSTIRVYHDGAGNFQIPGGAVPPSDFGFTTIHTTDDAWPT